MSFTKRATISHDIEALNIPESEEWELLNTGGIEKNASITKSKDKDLGGFDLEAEIEKNPNHLFVKVFAIKENEINDNGDAFSREELKKATDTFIGCPVFVNHQNDDVEKARGVVAHAWFDEDKGGIFCINKVDKEAYPQLARGVEEGYIVGCFPPDAPVLMSDGTEKSIADIEHGDDVLTHLGNIKKVTGRRQRGYKHPLYSIKLEGIEQPLICTSHHHLMAYKLPEECLCDCEEVLTETEDQRITTKDFGGKFKTGHNMRGQAVQHESVQKTKACDLSVGDFLFEPHFSDESADSVITEDEAFLIGLFLAEGSFEKRDGIRYAAIFNFGADELETLAFQCSEKLENVFSDYNVNPKTDFYPDASSTRITLYDTIVADWFYKWCGEHSDGKTLHPDLLNLGEEKTAALLAGYIEGNGYNVKKKTYGAATVSPKLASQLRTLFRKIGVRTKYRNPDDKNRWGYKKVHELTFGLITAKSLQEKLLYKQADIDQYEPADWHDTDNITLRRIESIDEVDYDGIVYDLEIEDDHTYCVNHIAVSNTSMGCKVTYSLCSICHNKAHTADEFCFSENTPILLEDFSVKPIQDIEIGDTVIDAYGKPTKVTHLFKRDFSGKACVIKSRSICGDVISTPNHPFLVRCRGEYRYHPVEFIQDGETLFTPIASVEEDNKVLAEHDIDENFAEDFAFLLGVYAAEGSLIRRNGKVKGVEFSLHQDESAIADRISAASLAIFGKKPYDYKLSQNGLVKSRRVRIWNVRAAEVFEALCPGTVRDRTKKFNRTVFSLNKNLKKVLVGAFVDGDGYVQGGSEYDRIAKSGACYALMSQMFYMSLHCGASPSMNSYINYSDPRNRDKTSTIYRVSIGNTQAQLLGKEGDKLATALQTEASEGKLLNTFTEDGLFAKHAVYAVDEVDYDGKVFNFETESGSYVANNTAVHNCTHIKNQKTRKYQSRHTNCRYHDSPCKPTDDCPVCGCKAGKKKANSTEGVKVFEWNYGISFIEDSFVVDPACHECVVQDVLNVPAIESKLSSKVSELEKLSEAYEKNIKEGNINKEAGNKEVQALNDAMNLIEKVTRSIMAQKQQIDMEYASDLIDVVANLQNTTDELVEMGYTQLPSPQESETMFGSNDAASPMDQQGGIQMSDPNMIGGPSTGQPQQQQQQAQPPQSQISGVETNQAPNEVGTVTRPKISSSNTSAREEFFNKSNKIKDNVRKLNSRLKWAKSLSDSRRQRVALSESTYQATDGDTTITINTNNDDGEIEVGKWRNGALVSWASGDDFSDDMRKTMIHNPQEAAERIIAEYQKETNTMSNVNDQGTKTAAGRGVSEEQTEMITQKQFDNTDVPLHDRWEEGYNTITEGGEQIGGDTRRNDTTTASPQTRQENPYEFITQAQLEEIRDGYLVRWASYPEVITEKQWDDISREISGKINQDYTDEITQAQLRSLLEDHRWEDPEVITQEQLSDQGSTMPYASAPSRWEAEVPGWEKKSSSRFDPKHLVKSATNAVADAIANYGLSPNDIRKSIVAITNNPQSQLKTAYLVLTNALPDKISARRDARVREGYFSKLASYTSNDKPIDRFLGAMGDNVGYSKAEDFLDAVKFVVNDNSAFKKAESLAQEKIASASNSSNDEVVDKNSKFANAFDELYGDGIYKLCGTMQEDLNGADPSDKPNFLKSIVSYAKGVVNKPIVLSSVETDDENGTFEAIVKDQSVASQEELDSFASLESKNFKTAESSKANYDEEEDEWEDQRLEEEADHWARSQERSDSNDKKKRQRAAARQQKLERTAQMMGGQMPTGLGDGGGSGASLPTPPDATGNQPGLESMEQGDADMDGRDLDEESDLADGDLDPAPPGTKCPVCGSEDVDLMDGKGSCNNCGAESVYKIDIEVLKWPGTIGEDEDSEDEGMEGEGFAVEDEAGLDQDLPVAAYTKITDHSLNKIADQGVRLGTVSPYTGSTNTVQISDNERLCLNTGRSYRITQAMKDNDWYVQWTWTPPVTSECPTCDKAKKSFASAIEQYGISNDEFESMSLEDRGKVILAMNEQGLLKRIKTAQMGSVISDYRNAHQYGVGETFPYENCKELISRRFGQNSVALSGPDEGENLPEAVCKRLRKANMYSDKMAIKVAQVWSEPDACIECLEDFVRSGFSAKQASLICDQLKTKYAQAIEMLADELDDDTLEISPEGDIDDMNDMDTHDDGSLFDEPDPFDEGAEDEGFVTVDIPLDALEQFDEALDKALGVDPSTEEHHEEGALPEGEASMEIPSEAAEEIDDAADDALDAAVDASEAGEEAAEEAIEEETEPDDETIEDSMEENIEEEDSVFDDSSEDSGSEDEEDEDYPEGKSEDDHGHMFLEGMDEPMEETAYAQENLTQKKDYPSNKSNGNGRSASVQEQVMNDSESFKRGKISKSHEVGLDLTSVQELLAKQAADSNIEYTNVQDKENIQPISGSDKSQMGHEEKLSLEDPNAPSAGAGSTMGKESDDLVPEENTTVPHGENVMGHEDEQGYTPEDGNEATGGEEGAGTSRAAEVSEQTVKTSSHTNNLAERLIKSAGKLDEKEPVSEDEDVEPISNNEDHPDTPKGSRKKPFDESDKHHVNTVPEAGKGAFMGHEEGSLNDVPKSPEEHPEAPSGGGSHPHYDRNERYDAEKQEHVKGTVIAGGDEESLQERRSEAIKVAAQMLQHKYISAGDMPSKVDELSRYNIEQIRDFEKAIFASANKGLDTVAQGIEKPLVISEKSNVRDANSELSERIQGLFKLEQQNQVAAEDDEDRLRRLRY